MGVIAAKQGHCCDCKREGKVGTLRNWESGGHLVRHHEARKRQGRATIENSTMQELKNVVDCWHLAFVGMLYC
jgi:hypothetical protein